MIQSITIKSAACSLLILSSLFFMAVPAISQQGFEWQVLPGEPETELFNLRYMQQVGDEVYMIGNLSEGDFLFQIPYLISYNLTDNNWTVHVNLTEASQSSIFVRSIHIIDNKAYIGSRDRVAAGNWRAVLYEYDFTDGSLEVVTAYQSSTTSVKGIYHFREVGNRLYYFGSFRTSDQILNVGYIDLDTGEAITTGGRFAEDVIVHENHFYIAGRHGWIDDHQNVFIAKVNLEDGTESSLDSFLGSNIQSKRAYSILHDDGNIWLGGFFDTVSGVQSSNVARYNLQEQTWNQVTTGFTNGQIDALVLFDGEIYASGNFTIHDGEPVNRIARVDQSNQKLVPLGVGLNARSRGMSVINGEIWVWGGFTEAGGKPVNGVARWTDEDGPVSTEPISELPKGLQLNQNYPNPFNPVTRISFELPESMDVQLEVFNIQGQRVASLVNGTRAAGFHTVSFEAGSLASGVYIYRLQTPAAVLTRSMMLVK